MKKLRQFLCVLAFASVLTSCRDYYKDSITWMDNIKPGTTLQEVKKNQPDFLTIDWNKSDTLDNQIRFTVTEIKGNDDILAMTHLLVFVDDKFQSRESHK